MGTTNSKKPLPNRFRTNAGSVDLAENLEQFERLSSHANNFINNYTHEALPTTNVEADFNRMQHYADLNTHSNSPTTTATYKPPHMQQNPSKIIHNFKPYPAETYQPPQRNDLQITPYEMDNERRQMQYYQPRSLEPNIFTNVRPIIPDYNYKPAIQPTPPVLVPHNVNVPLLTRQMSTKEDKTKAKYLKTLNKNTINPAVVNPTQSTLKKLYDIQPYEMRKLQKLFFQYAGSDRKMNFQEFVKLYGNINPSLRGPDIVNIAEQAFMASDANDDGLLNFDEFLIAYCLTKPDRSFAGFPDLWKPSLNHLNENVPPSSTTPPPFLYNTLRKNTLPTYASQPQIQPENLIQPLPIEYQQPSVETHQIAAPPAIEYQQQQQPQQQQPPQMPPPVPVSIQQPTVQHQQQPSHIPVQQPVQAIEAYTPPLPPPPPPPQQMQQTNQLQPVQPVHQQQQHLSYYNSQQSYEEQEDQPTYDYSNRHYAEQNGYGHYPMSEYQPPSEFSPYPPFDLNLLPPAPALLASSRQHKRVRHKPHNYGSVNKMSHIHNDYYHQQYHHHHHHHHHEPRDRIDQHRQSDDHPPLFDLDDPASYKPQPPARHTTKRRQRS